MAEGWSPLGGVAVDRNGGWPQLLQTMTKPGARREVPEKKD